ncbi:hypothetical protein ABDI49_21705 [Bacillus cereus]
MKKRFCILMLVMLFSIGLGGCEGTKYLDRYNPFASKTDVYGVVMADPVINAKAKENDVVSYDYNLKGYDKDLNQIDMYVSSPTKHPIGTYFKAIKKGDDPRMWDETVVKKEDIPANILNKLNESQK